MNKKSRLVLIFTLTGAVIFLFLGLALNQNIRQIIPNIILKGLSFFEVPQELIIITPARLSVDKKVTTTVIISTSTTATPKNGSKPTTCYPVPSGPQTYNISTDNASTKDNPEITQIFINPLDVQKSARQIVSVNIKDIKGKSIIEVLGTAVTDNNSVNFPLFLISGTSISGTWQGSWLNQDSYCQKYTLSIIAKSESDQSDIVLTFK